MATLDADDLAAIQSLLAANNPDISAQIAYDIQIENNDWGTAPDNFCIDHIQSMADGGTNDVENLQCVHPLVNKMKGTMSNEQFIELCRRVAEAQNAKQHPPPYK